MGHNHHHGAHDSDKKGLLFSILLNIGIVVAEFVGGIFSGSMALLSDAIHNLSDVLSLILSYAGEHISKRQKDEKHTFAFKRAEVIIAFVNSMTLVIVGIYIIYEAIKRFYIGQHEINSTIMFMVGIIGLLGNFISILFLHREKDDNLNKKSAYLHLFFDTISSLIVVVGGVIIYYTHFYILDLIASIIISFFVIHSGFEIFKRSLHILMQGVPENIKMKEILDGIKNINGICDVHDLHIWSIDSNDSFLSSHIIVENDVSVDRIIKDINEFLDTHYHIHHTSLQVVKNKCC